MCVWGRRFFPPTVWGDGGSIDGEVGGGLLKKKMFSRHLCARPKKNGFSARRRVVVGGRDGSVSAWVVRAFFSPSPVLAYGRMSDGHSSYAYGGGLAAARGGVCVQKVAFAPPRLAGGLELNPTLNLSFPSDRGWRPGEGGEKVDVRTIGRSSPPFPDGTRVLTRRGGREKPNGPPPRVLVPVTVSEKRLIPSWHACADL